MAVHIVWNVVVVDQVFDRLRDGVLAQPLELVGARAEAGSTEQVFDLRIDG